MTTRPENAVEHLKRAATAAERQRRYRQARDAAGLVEVRNLWVHPDDVEAIKKLARELAEKRKAYELALEQSK